MITIFTNYTKIVVYVFSLVYVLDNLILSCLENIHIINHSIVSTTIIKSAGVY